MTLTTDVEVLLGRDLTAAEDTRVARLLEMAYGLITTGLPGFSVTTGTAEDELIQHDDPDTAWTELYPVTDVTEVKLGDAVLSETSYEWTDKGRITLRQRYLLNEFEIEPIRLDGFYAYPLTVSYAYGLNPLPNEVATVVASFVAGLLRGQATNPDGVTSERLGAYEVSYGAQAAAGFTGVEGGTALLRRWSRTRQVSAYQMRR